MDQLSALALGISVSVIVSTIVTVVMTEPLRIVLRQLEDPATFLVLDQGRQFTDSNAAIHTIAALGGIWRFADAARVVPKTWRDSLYRLLARKRHRRFGRRSTCYLSQ